MRATTKIVIYSIIGVLLIVLWLSFIDISQMLKILSQISPGYVVLSVLFYILAYLARSFRWKTILKNIIDLSISEVFNLFMAGMLINYIIPVRAGELAKSFFIKTRHKLPVSRTLPTVFIDKLTDMTPILLLFLMLPFLPIEKNATISTILWSVSAIFLIFIFLFIFAVRSPDTATRLITSAFFFIPKKSKEKICGFIKVFVSSLSRERLSLGSTLIVIGATLTAVALDTLYIIFMFKAFGFDISPSVAFFGYTLINLSYILPTPPAQIGSNEAIYIVVFSVAFLIDKNLVSATLGFAHLLTGSLIFLIGIIALGNLNISFKKALKFSKE